MLYHFASAKRNYPQWLASHPDGYVLVVKLPFTPAEMPRHPDGSVDIEAFPERIFGSDHVVRQPDGSVEYAGVPEPAPRPAPRILHRATCRMLQTPAEDCQMICGTRDELDASLRGEEDVQLCAACC
jgi:hypothetical protein